LLKINFSNNNVDNNDKEKSGGVMTDKDFVKISTDSIRVLSSNDNNKNKFDEEKKNKKNQEKKELENNFEQNLDELNTSEFIEFSNNSLSRTNSDEHTFVEIKNSQLDRVGNKNKIDLLPIDELVENVEVFNINEEQTIVNLNKLYELYKIYLLCLKDENKILNIDDIDFLDEIIRQKDIVLTKIENTSKDIDFKAINEYLKNNIKIIKVEDIINDIKSVVNEIITIEDENRVELQSLCEKMKFDISRQEKSAKVLFQFEQSTEKSHFIDTKK
jgi:hypothetical protein